MVVALLLLHSQDVITTARTRPRSRDLLRLRQRRREVVHNLDDDLLGEVVARHQRRREVTLRQSTKQRPQQQSAVSRY